MIIYIKTLGAVIFNTFQANVRNFADNDTVLTRTKLRRWKSDLHKQAKIRVRSFHDRKVL